MKRKKTVLRHLSLQKWALKSTTYVTYRYHWVKLEYRWEATDHELGARRRHLVKLNAMTIRYINLLIAHAVLLRLALLPASTLPLLPGSYSRLTPPTVEVRVVWRFISPGLAGCSSIIDGPLIALRNWNVKRSIQIKQITFYSMLNCCRSISKLIYRAVCNGFQKCTFLRSPSPSQGTADRKFCHGQNSYGCPTQYNPPWK